MKLISPIESGLANENKMTTIANEAATKGEGVIYVSAKEPEFTLEDKVNVINVSCYLPFVADFNVFMGMLVGAIAVTPNCKKIFLIKPRGFLTNGMSPEMTQKMMPAIMTFEKTYNVEVYIAGSVPKELLPSSATPFFID